MQQFRSRRGGLTGKQKAAILMVTLGPELSANVYKHLREEEIEDLTLEIANIKKVEPQLRDEILAEFKEIAKAQERYRHRRYRVCQRSSGEGFRSGQGRGDHPEADLFAAGQALRLCQKSRPQSAVQLHPGGASPDDLLDHGLSPA